MLENWVRNIVPLHRKKGVKKFSVDIYGLKCDVVLGEVISVWDGLRMELNSVLPMKFNNSFQRATTDNNNQTKRSFGMPFDPQCLRRNIYGDNFLEKEGAVLGKKRKAKLRKDAGYFRVGHPWCEKYTPSDLLERQEFANQLVLCEDNCDMSRANIQVLENITNGLPAQSSICNPL